MFILITGGSGSGKSAYAEERVLSFSQKKRYYLATMQVYGEEGQEKVNRHRELRKNKGFETIEKQRNIGEVTKEHDLSQSTVLLECMSNLVANEMFQDNTQLEVDEVISLVISGMDALIHQAKNLIVVTNNIFEDGIAYDESTEKYREALAKINEKLAKAADEVIEVVVGISVRISTSDCNE